MAALIEVNLKASLNNSSFIRWAAWRQLASRRSRHKGLSFMTVFSILGVTFGVAALVIVLSVMGGFEEILKDKMLRGQAHVEILAENSILGFPLSDKTFSKLEKTFPEAIGMQSFVQADVVIKQRKHLSAAIILGLDNNTEESLWALKTSMIEGSFDTITKEHYPLISYDDNENKWPGIILGEGLASQLGADLGDEITIVSPQASSSSTIISGGTVSRNYVVTGLFQSGLGDYDSKYAVTSISEARKFMIDYDSSMDDENYVTGIAFNLENPYMADTLKKRLKLKGLQLRNWRDDNAALLSALLLEKYTMGAILTLIVLVAAFSISGTMMMSVFHRKTQLSLFRALGFTQKNVLYFYVIQGFIIGSLGILLGLFFGLGFCSFLHFARDLDVPVGLNALQSLPVKFLPFEYFLIALMAWFLSIIGALYPAMTASKQNPSIGLRYS